MQKQIPNGSVEASGSDTNPKVSLLTYSRRVKLQQEAPILPLPDVQQLCRLAQPPSFTPRRSALLAASSMKSALVEQQTQLMLARSLEFSQDQSSTLIKFKELFNAPLPREHILTLAALFRMLVPAGLPSELPVAEVCEEQGTPVLTC